MFKFKQGWIESKAGVRKEIEVSPSKGNGALLAGGIGLVCAGVVLLAGVSYRIGAASFEQGECQTLHDLGLLDPENPTQRSDYAQTFDNARV